ncbi:hypothetical protein [Roseomonas populi]|uniref:Methyltransferase type 11 domain-containing protein n=1 Tax=Roseomonas populi TaxID=3121582 RepID=A0ABT1X4M3_9PROT|nr:hypothetical protein [Roseomonas pecuniae]MCR0982112.1 hypothetical protein [Roseomonas pecuniae]
MSQTHPADDSAEPAWAGAARFLEGRIPPGGRVIAPESFARLAGALSAPDPENIPDWAVIRTATAGSLPPGLLRRLLAETTPVFANEGYVVFARRPTFGLADMRNAPAVRALADGAALGAPFTPPGPTLLEASQPKASAPPEAGMVPIAPPRAPDIPRANLPPEALALQVPAPAPRADRPAFPLPRPFTAPEPPPGFAPPQQPAAAPPEPPRLFPVPAAANTPPVPRLFAVPPAQPVVPPEPASFAPPAAPPEPASLLAPPPAPAWPVPPPERATPEVPPASAPAATLPSGTAPRGTLPARVAALLGTGAGRRVALLGADARGLAAALDPAALVSDAEGQPDACFDLLLLAPGEASLAGAAADAARLLRPGGLLLIVAENTESLGRRLAAALGRPAPAGLSASTIRGALHAAGLVPERLEGHALDTWRATADLPPPGLAPGDPASALLEDAASTMDPRHAAWLLFLARKP